MEQSYFFKKLIVERVDKKSSIILGISRRLVWYMFIDV
jgi:hypothetical protein